MRPTLPLVFPFLLLALFHVNSGQNTAGGLITVPPSNTRAITVDYDHDHFLLDGQPFRYISGSFHYFRAVPESWRKIIRLMKAAGLNAVSTYVEWSLHNPKDGVYEWTGIADLENFLSICKEEDMFVLLRPGPYICAERDLGGFPVWLLNKYPNINLRTTDSSECYYFLQGHLLTVSVDFFDLPILLRILLKVLFVDCHRSLQKSQHSV